MSQAEKSSAELLSNISTADLMAEVQRRMDAEKSMAVQRGSVWRARYSDHDNLIVNKELYDGIDWILYDYRVAINVSKGPILQVAIDPVDRETKLQITEETKQQLIEYVNEWTFNWVNTYRPEYKYSNLQELQTDIEIVFHLPEFPPAVNSPN